MFNRGVHIEILQMLLFVAHNHVNVVGAFQTMVGYGKQAVYVRRQIDAGNRRTLVDHQVDKARILVGKAIVILPPDGGGDQQVKR